MLKSTPLASKGFKTCSKCVTGGVIFSPPTQWSNILPKRSKVGLENIFQSTTCTKSSNGRGLGVPSKLVNFEVQRCFDHSTIRPRFCPIWWSKVGGKIVNFKVFEIHLIWPSRCVNQHLSNRNETLSSISWTTPIRIPWSMGMVCEAFWEEGPHYWGSLKKIPNAGWWI